MNHTSTAWSLVLEPPVAGWCGRYREALRTFRWPRKSAKVHYYGDGIFESVDLGQTWVPLAPGTFDNVAFTKLAIIPSNGATPATLLATAGPGAQLRAELTQIGYVLQGSVTERRIPCGKDACACITAVGAWHGPYIQWSRRKAGRTVSTYLTPQQATLCREWIANYRTLDKIIGRMLKLSLRIARLYEIPKL